MTWFLDTGIVAALVGAVSGWFVPRLIARVPEPEPEPPDHEADEEGGQQEAEPKETYAAIGALPRLTWKCALATAVVAGFLGARVGWTPELSFLLFLSPVGVALAVIDWRTRLLPTKVIAPSYVVVAVLATASAAVGGDWSTLLRAGLAWVVSFVVFFVLWWIYPAGLGYGDVRLSGLIGIAMGWFGWSVLMAGLYTGFLLGSVIAALLSLLRIVDRKGYPFGPFLLVGAWLAIAFTPYVVGFYFWLFEALSRLIAAGLGMVISG